MLMDRAFMDKTTRSRPSVGARLFTASDVERAARLAALEGAANVSDPETCVRHALAVVADESPLYYSESEVRSMFQYTLSKEDVDAELADAVQAIGR